MVTVDIAVLRKILVPFPPSHLQLGLSAGTNLIATPAGTAGEEIAIWSQEGQGGEQIACLKGECNHVRFVLPHSCVATLPLCSVVAADPAVKVAHEL
jgi:hypothetical protein